MIVGKHGWKVRVWQSGSFDFKVSQKPLQIHCYIEISACARLHPHSNNHMHRVSAHVAFFFFTLMKRNKWERRRRRRQRRGWWGDCALLTSVWMVIFIRVDMSSEVKNLTNKLATQFCPRRDKDTGVLCKHHKNAGAFCFHRHSGTRGSGWMLIFKEWRNTQHMDSIWTFLLAGHQTGLFCRCSNDGKSCSNPFIW